MSLQPRGRDPALQTRDQSAEMPADEIDKESVAEDANNAGDRPPVQDIRAPLYPATETLLRPPIYRDPTATIEIPPILLAGPATTASLPYGRIGAAQQPDLVRSMRNMPARQAPTTQPRSVPARPSPAPQQPKTTPESRPPSRWPYWLPWPFQREPEPKPDELEPPQPRQTESIPRSEVTPERPAPQREDPPSTDFSKALTAYLLRPDYRGSSFTTEGNRMLAERCHKILEIEYPDIARITKHVGGSYKNGKLDDYLFELVFGKRRPDLSWMLEYLDEQYFAHINTAAMRKSGRLTGREQRAFDDLVKEVGDGIMQAMRKFRPGDSVDKYQEEADEKCRNQFNRLRKLKQRSDDKRKESREKLEKPQNDGDGINNSTDK